MLKNAIEIVVCVGRMTRFNCLQGNLLNDLLDRQVSVAGNRNQMYPFGRHTTPIKTARLELTSQTVLSPGLVFRSASVLESICGGIGFVAAWVGR